MKDSKIEWTDHTFNPWIGCTRVSPGCQHCYAETMMADRYKKVQWGPQGQRVRTSIDYWNQPARWNRAAEAAGERRRVFVASLADVFEDKPDQRAEMDEWRDMLFHFPHLYSDLDWLFLTKRPENVMSMVHPLWLERGFPPNVWIGTSVENQKYADERIPELLKIPAAVRFLSVEPMLGPVDLTCVMDRTGQDPDGGYLNALRGFTFDSDGDYSRRIGRHINWVIVGGESGHGARPMDPDWVRSIRDLCQEAGVPFFLKQWGEWTPDYNIGVPTNSAIAYHDKQTFYKVGKKKAGRLLDGREWNEFPKVETTQSE